MGVTRPPSLMLLVLKGAVIVVNMLIFSDFILIFILDDCRRRGSDIVDIVFTMCFNLTYLCPLQITYQSIGFM